MWSDITPIARRDWIAWITSAKQPETRARRIQNVCEMLATGKRRVCWALVLLRLRSRRRLVGWLLRELMFRHWMRRFPGPTRTEGATGRSDVGLGADCHHADNRRKAGVTRRYHPAVSIA